MLQKYNKCDFSEGIQSSCNQCFIFAPWCVYDLSAHWLDILTLVLGHGQSFILSHSRQKEAQKQHTDEDVEHLVAEDPEISLRSW